MQPHRPYPPPLPREPPTQPVAHCPSPSPFMEVEPETFHITRATQLLGRTILRWEDERDQYPETLVLGILTRFI